MKTLVHDVSHWQGDLSRYWQDFKDKGCKAVIVKATEGYAYYNSYVTQITQAKEFGFLVGSYHYFRQRFINLNGQSTYCDPVRQAKNHYDWVIKTGIELDLPPALDVEKGNNPYLKTDDVIKCLDEMKTLFGRAPIFYSSPAVVKYQLGSDKRLGKYDLWVANYNVTSPGLSDIWDNYVLWQFSDKITYDKVNSSGTIVSRKPIDHNWFNGSVEDLYKYCDYKEVPSNPTRIQIKDFAKPARSFLLLRAEPNQYESNEIFALGAGAILEIAGDKISSDIDYYPVRVPKKYAFDGVLYVTATPTYINLIP